MKTNLKNKGLLIAVIIFFLIINTTYYWEVKLGFFIFPAFLILVVVHFVFAIILIGQIYFAVKEKLTNKPRLLTIGLLTIVLVLTFIRPYGLIDFDRLQGGDILIAEREGAANCTTTLKLKDNFTFRERSVCFEVSEIVGKYRFQNDTIYFDNVKSGKNKTEYYQFAVIRSPSEYGKSKYIADLMLYKNLDDTLKRYLMITKNELDKLENKNRYNRK